MAATELGFVRDTEKSEVFPFLKEAKVQQKKWQVYKEL